MSNERLSSAIFSARMSSDELREQIGVDPKTVASADELALLLSRLTRDPQGGCACVADRSVGVALKGLFELDRARSRFGLASARVGPRIDGTYSVDQIASPVQTGPGALQSWDRLQRVDHLGMSCVRLIGPVLLRLRTMERAPRDHADERAWPRLSDTVSGVSTPSDEQAREWQFFEQVIDPGVRDLLALDDPWEAYRGAMAVSALLTDTSPGGSFELPHSGSVYVAWSELADLYDTGKTPVGEAHATLRRGATRWLDRPAEPDAGFIERWTSEASQAVAALYERDGNWWRGPR